MCVSAKAAQYMQMSKHTKRSPLEAQMDVEYLVFSYVEERFVGLYHVDKN